MSPCSSPPSLTFGSYRIDPANDLLLRDGAVVALAPKAVQVLSVLVQRSGDVVDKEELLAEVWPEDDIEENNIAQAICAIRAAIGDRRRPHRCVETITGRGYRFVRQAAVEDVVPQVVRPAPARAAASSPSPAIRNDTRAPDAAPPAEPLAHRPVIMVRAFRWLGPGDADTQGWAAALTEAVFTRLSEHARVKSVLAGSAPLSSAASPAAIVTLQASVQQGHDRLRVSVQLADGVDGSASWGATFDERTSDRLDAQDRLADRITATVVARVITETVEMQARATPRAPLAVGAIARPPSAAASRLGDAAYLSYRRGRYLLERRTRAALFEAVDVFTRVARTPSLSGLSHVGLAEAYTLLGEYDYVPAPQALATARLAAQQALAMGLGGQAHTSLAEARLYGDWDSAGAEREYQRAVTLDPGYVTAHHWYGWFLVTQDRFDEGLAELQCAHDLDPLSLAVATDLGWALMCAEDYGRAVEHLRHAAALDSTFFLAPFYLGLAHGLQGHDEAAVRELRKAEAIEDNPQAIGQLGFAYAAVGRVDEARQRLQRLEERSRREYVSPYVIALIHAGLADQDRALGWFARAVSERSASLLWPGTKLLRSRFGAESRLDRLLVESGLPR